MPPPDGSDVPTPRRPLTVGWSEYVSLPEWGVEYLHAKIDTGARTSALHVENIEPVGEDRVRFDIVLSRRHPDRRRTVEAEVVKRAPVRNSTGAMRKRWFVRTRLRLGPVEKEILVSLVSRDRMVFRMLLGREALGEDFLVNSGARRLVGERPPCRSRRASKPGSDST